MNWLFGACESTFFVIAILDDVVFWLDLFLADSLDLLNVICALGLSWTKYLGVLVFDFLDGILSLFDSLLVALAIKWVLFDLSKLLAVRQSCNHGTIFVREDVV